MFLKPFKIKSNNQLKVTENFSRKQLKEDFKRSFPKLTDKDLDSIFTKKDAMTVMKLETASHLNVQLYLLNKRAIAFVYEKVLFPTVYFLWRHSDILLTFTTHSTVLTKLIDGANLMLPGVVYPRLDASSTTVFPNNTPVCINVTTNKAAVAVGITAQSSTEMIKSNYRGKGVVIYHVVGDKLCTLENLECLPIPEAGIPDWKMESGNVGVENEYVKETVKTGESSTFETNEAKESLTNVESNAVEQSVEEVDALLNTSFMCAIKYSKALTLPILTSTFYKVFMVPACPPGKTIDLKKSSYKKLSNFLQHMMELGIIKVEEQKKGVDSITKIDKEHILVIGFTLAPAERPVQSIKKTNETPEIAITEAHSVTAAVLPIFSEFGYVKGSVIDNANVRKYITEYVKRHNLQDENDKRFVKINASLKGVSPKEILVTFQKLIDKTYSVMSPCYKIICGDKETVHKGTLSPISITVVKRSQCKKVTLVDNLTLFSLDIKEIANACQHGVAASTNINHSQGVNKTDQLQIQGNQVLFIYNLLIDKYKVPKNYVKGLEFAPKKKH